MEAITASIRQESRDKNSMETAIRPFGPEYRRNLLPKISNYSLAGQIADGIRVGSGKELYSRSWLSPVSVDNTRELQRHIQHCRATWHPWSTVSFIADRLYQFVAPRFITTLAATTVISVLVSRLV
jgi:hypothetical protein